ncbi:hypothetical protein [Pseudomonas germanica]
MRFQILDVKQEGNSHCFLVKASLQEYLAALPSDYSSYGLQRSIVSNVYLDRMIDTVLNKSHIPSITLVATSHTSEVGGVLEGDFKILDGLQRTHRLKVISDTKDLFLSRVVQDLALNDFQLRRKYRDELASLGSSGNILLSIKNFYDREGGIQLESCFSGVSQWFEIWVGLTPSEEVRKMLMLNAGHKPVSIKHQLELLFINILPAMSEAKSGRIKIFRDKDVPSASFSKQRSLGEYQFSQLISALVSFVEKKPVATNAEFVESVQNDEGRLGIYIEKFTFEFLEAFVKAIYAIDAACHEDFGSVGNRWVAREVSLAAVFAAIGVHCNDVQDIEKVVRGLVGNFNKCKLDIYEEARNSVDLAKVNIGRINKGAIFSGFNNFIDSGFSAEINWPDTFMDVA